MGSFNASEILKRSSLSLAGLTLLGSLSIISVGPSLFEFSIIKNEFGQGESKLVSPIPAATTPTLDGEVVAEFRKLRDENQSLKARMESLEAERSTPGLVKTSLSETSDPLVDQQSRRIDLRSDRVSPSREDNELSETSPALKEIQTILKPVDVVEHDLSDLPNAETIEEAQSCYRRARQALLNDDIGSAMQSLDTAIALNPAVAIYWYSRGFVQHKVGRFSESDSDFRAGAQRETIRSKEISSAMEMFQGEGRASLERFRPPLKKKQRDQQ